jgi:PAS domain S-box-containing protein
MVQNKHTNYERYNILLIEDNPGDARLVEILLEESDFYECEIINKTTLADGIQALKEEYFAAVLLDLTLPDSRGFETLEQLIEACPDVNVIVMTGLAAKEIGIRAVKAGAQDFLVKGDFDSDQLAKTLRYSIERKSVLQRLEEAQRIAHIGNWDYNLVTQEFTLSDEIYRIFGYSSKEIILNRKMLLEHIHHDDLSILQELYESALSNEQLRRDLRIRNLSGELRYVSIQLTNSTSIRDAGKTPNKVSGIVQDITTRKHAELELLKSQERYQAIFSQSKDAIYISNGTNLVDFNDATVQLFGYSAEELRTLSVDDLYKNPQDKVAFTNAMKNLSFVKDYEVELMRKDGTVRLCLLTSNAIITDEFNGYHGIIRDVTARKQTEELRKAKELAERSALMKEKFLANVSHEMRTPMNAILGLTNLLLKTDFNEEQHNYLTSIRESSQHLLGIINDILEVSSLKEGKINLAENEFDLHELVTHIVNVFDYNVKEKGLALNVTIDKNVDKLIMGDKLRLKQILTNLVGNAVKFTEKGSVVLAVRKTREAKEHAFFEFRVTDTGIGIPDDKVEMIFETFAQVFDEKIKTYGGTGLGLSITKQLVQLHKGTIRVESKVGEGSVFICEIPFKKAVEHPKTQIPVEDEKVTLDIGRDIQILLVEDHKLNQIVARKTLEKEFPNVVVTIADNGKIAIEKLEKQDFDLILMDIQMPVMDGYEATRYIRENMPENKAKTTIFAMTAHAHMAQDDKFLEYGMDDCVLKPFDPKQLFSKITHYILKNNQPNSLTEEINNAMNTPVLIDLSYMELMADGDDDMKKVMLELLFEEPVEEIKMMHTFVQRKDWSSLKNVSHKMKSTLAFVGNDTLTETNKAIEKSAMEETNLDKLPELVLKLDKLYQAALVELKAEHAKLD